MNTSSRITIFSRRAFLRTTLCSMLLVSIVLGFLWYLDTIGASLTLYDYLGLGAVILLVGLLQWRTQRSLLADVLRSDITASPVRPAAARSSVEDSRETAAEQAKREGREKRLFLHLVGVLQREGRLMDFLKEDLTAYEDSQIGAAVRTIHASCGKTLATYLDLEPVMSQPEGATVDIDADFDPSIIKLVGNVVGKPPFSGILRHRGWQLRSCKLPELGDVPNSDVLAPAEVELQ
jgi:hypothetical protein